MRSTAKHRMYNTHTGTGPAKYVLFERSEFLIATSKNKKTDRLCGCLCGCSSNLGFSVENTKKLGFSVGYVLCASPYSSTSIMW